MNNLFLFFFQYILIKIAFEQDKNYCDLNHECDNCEICGQDTNNFCSCNFYNAYCKNSDSNNFTISTDFLYSYDGCKKSNNNNNENICGKSNIDIDIGTSKKINFKSSYNANFLCFYNVKKTKNNNNDINILIKKEGEEIKNINMHLISYYNYGQIKVISYMNLLVISKSFELKEPNTEKISVYIDIPNGRVMDDVSITFSMDNSTIKKVTYVTSSNTNKIIIFITVLSSLVLIIIIIILCLIKNICSKKTYIQNGISNNSITKNSNNNSLINKNKEEMNNLFKTKIIPITYIKNNTVNDCYKCTICLEDFIDGSSVIIITECNHSFHFECFKNWVFKNIIFPKCPNCNKPILDPNKNNQININEISNSMNSTIIENNANITIN